VQLLDTVKCRFRVAPRLTSSLPLSTLIDSSALLDVRIRWDAHSRAQLRKQSQEAMEEVGEQHKAVKSLQEKLESAQGEHADLAAKAEEAASALDVKVSKCHELAGRTHTLSHTYARAHTYTGERVP
jgi:chromosome segregation ATPase